MTYTISLTEAASQLAEIVHRLRQNDTVVLVENDVPVAEIIPKQAPLLVSKDIAAEWLHLSNQVRAMPHIGEISEEDIRAEIDAYRSGR
jgi:antitoxin (DNA-binding transcriptional repressor) of toxin-antitoxin stability system